MVGDETKQVSALRRLLGRATRVVAPLTLAAALLLGSGRADSSLSAHPVDLPYVRGELVVGYRPPIASVASDIRSATALKVTTAGTPDPTDQVVTLPRGASVLAEAARVRRLPGIAYAVPNYIAHMAGGWIPDDPGRAGEPGGWQQLQWNYTQTYGIDAPGRLVEPRGRGHPGAKGVTVAVIDTGVAFRTWNGYARSPDFRGTRFVDPCDLVAGKLVNGRCTDPNAVDHEGHGTFVAGVIGEATNNGVGLTGLAYGASIMPIRVLNGQGLGSSSTIAEGIRYAVQHGAQVINLSLEFYLGVTPPTSRRSCRRSDTRTVRASSSSPPPAMMRHRRSPTRPRSPE